MIYMISKWKWCLQNCSFLSSLVQSWDLGGFCGNLQSFFWMMCTKGICVWVSIDALNRHCDQDLINSQSLVGGVSINAFVHSQPIVNQGADRVLMECQPRCRWSVQQVCPYVVSIEGINWHSTRDPLVSVIPLFVCFLMSWNLTSSLVITIIIAITILCLKCWRISSISCFLAQLSGTEILALQWHFLSWV